MTKIIAGFDNHMFPGEQIAIGSGAQAFGTGEISLSGNGVNISLLKGHVLVDGVVYEPTDLQDKIFTQILAVLFGEPPRV